MVAVSLSLGIMKGPISLGPAIFLIPAIRLAVSILVVYQTNFVSAVLVDLAIYLVVVDNFGFADKPSSLPIWARDLFLSCSTFLYRDR